MPHIKSTEVEAPESLREEVAKAIKELIDSGGDIQFFSAYYSDDGAEAGGCIMFADYDHYILTLHVAKMVGLQLAAKAKEELTPDSERNPKDWN